MRVSQRCCSGGVTFVLFCFVPEEISGVFVKSIAKGSAADLSRKIRVNDQVIEVDGRPLQGYSNHQAVELLRSTGKVGTHDLCLLGVVRGWLDD